MKYALKKRQKFKKICKRAEIYTKHDMLSMNLRKTIMKNFFRSACFCLGIVSIFISCALIPEHVESPPEESSTLAVIERPVKPPVPEYIMGRGQIHPLDMAAFLLESNPGANLGFVQQLAIIYAEEAAIEGVNHDIAFAQMCLETGFLAFGNLVQPEQNNFAGLGAIGPGQPGLSFEEPRIGVRAHIQHLKAYASDAPLEQELVNPRFRFVRRASAPSIKGLSGTWAADRSYDVKISNILERLYNFSFTI